MAIEDKVHIFLLEDDAVDAEMICRQLKKIRGLQVEVDHVSDPHEALQVLPGHPAGILILDYLLGAKTGLDVLQKLRQSGEDRPVIILTGRGNEKIAVEAMKWGAQDYFVKGELTPEGLHRAISNAVQKVALERRLHQKQQELAESEERFRQLADHVGEVFWIHDADGRRVQYVNSAYEVIWGRSCRSLYENPSSWLDAIDARDRDRVINAWFRQRTAGGFQEEYRIVDPEGQLHWIWHSSKVIRDQGGNALRIVGVARELTEQRYAESQLRLQSSALQAAANAIVITDPEGKVLWANEAFTQLSGYDFKEVANVPTRILRSGVHSPEFYRRLWSTILSGKVWKGEIVNRRKDGSLYTEEMTITPVTDQQGEISHFIAIKQDITVRKESEKIRLKHAKVEQERNHLRDAVKAFERVLGVVGHELRTPLGGVRTLTELMLKQEIYKTTESEGFIRNIRDEVVRMSQLVNDLLEVARINSGTAQWTWTEVHIEGVAEEAISTVSPLIDDGRVHLRLQMERPDLTMKGDSHAIRRLLVNLIHNACKHTSQGRIVVHIRELHEDGRRRIEMQVSDTGEGMTADIAVRLGEAFALNSGVVGENHVRGSGLGLAICRGIVAAHGGHIFVDTQPGEGTTMTVLLDAELAAPAPTDNSAAIVSHAGTSG